MRDKENEPQKKHRFWYLRYIIMIMVFILFIYLLISVSTNIERGFNNRLNSACNYCGYGNYTDYTDQNNYNSMFSPIKLLLVECDGRNIISLYDGVVSRDKWGNEVIKKEDIVFCER